MKKISKDNILHTDESKIDARRGSLNLEHILLHECDIYNGVRSYDLLRRLSGSWICYESICSPLSIENMQRIIGRD